MESERAYVGYYMDGFLQDNLDIAKSAIRKDLDMVIAVDGAEGSGKSVFTMQVAKYCDPSFTLKCVAFTANQFRKAVIAAEPYTAVVYDEAYTGLASRAAMSIINRGLVSMLAEIRQKNLFVFIICPSFFDLDRYVALWRSRALLHVYMLKGFVKGQFRFYSYDNKIRLFVDGKKYYSYNPKLASFHGSFINHYVVDEAEYRQLKRNALSSREVKREEQEQMREVEDKLFERVMSMDIPHAERIRILQMPSSTYFGRLKRMQDGDIA